MQAVVTSLLRLKSVPKPDDAADALAIALCHGHSANFGELFAVGNMTRGKGQNTANAYQELMATATKKNTRAKSAFSSATSAAALQKATGIAGVTAVGRASLNGKEKGK